MTTISPSHRLANKAVLAVCEVLDRAGALAEQIRNDYGEDLLVQTQLANSADGFHLLIQVKGRFLKFKGGRFSLQFEVKHLQRWATHIQPVLVCVFDAVTKKVFAFNPRERFSPWELATTKRKSLSVNLGPDDLFDEKIARHHIWRCRTEYYSRMLSWYESNLLYSREDKSRAKKINLELNLVVFRFLQGINLIDDSDVFDVEFVASVRNASKNFRKLNCDKSKPKLLLNDLFVLCVLGQFERVAGGVGLPSNLLLNAGRVAQYFYRKIAPSEWRKAQRALSIT